MYKYLSNPSSTVDFINTATLRMPYGGKLADYTAAYTRKSSSPHNAIKLTIEPPPIETLTPAMAKDLPGIQIRHKNDYYSVFPGSAPDQLILTNSDPKHQNKILKFTDAPEVSPGQKRRFSAQEDVLYYSELKTLTPNPLKDRTAYIMESHIIIKGPLLGKGSFCEVYKGFLFHPETGLYSELAIRIPFKKQPPNPNYEHLLSLKTQEGCEGLALPLFHGDSDLGKIECIPLAKESLRTTVIGTLEAGEKILKDVQKALELLHKNNLIHGDITPSNILITHEGLIKITDFDGVQLSQKSTPSDSAFITTSSYLSSSIAGTYGATHPKQDFYALALVGLELWSRFTQKETPSITDISLMNLEKIKECLAPHGTKDDPLLTQCLSLFEKAFEIETTEHIQKD